MQPIKNSLAFPRIWRTIKLKSFWSLELIAFQLVPTQLDSIATNYVVNRSPRFGVFKIRVNRAAPVTTDVICERRVTLVPDAAKLKWHEPRWFYVPRLWRQLRQILNPRSLVTIVVVSAFVGAVIVAAFKFVIPQFVIPNTLWWMLLALPGVIVYLYFYLALLTVFPPTITVHNRSLQRTHSGAGPKIKPEHVQFARLTVHSNNRIRLKFRYRLDKLDRTSVFGVPSTVDLAILVRLLPHEPVIRDARDRWIKTENRK